jgi:Putative zinc-finger
MSCEKYSGWMTDAALGELGAERESELLAHAMECDSCRESLGRARQVRKFVDRGVEALVAGEPSPQFSTHLRRRIAQESEPQRSAWTAWAPVVAGALALAVVLAIMVARRPVHNESNPNVASAVNPISAPPGAASVASSRNAERTEHTPDSRRSAQTRAATTTRPEIIVPRGQLAAAAQLSAAINSGRVDGNQLLAAQHEYEKPLEVHPIEIAPLEIPALDEVTEKPAGLIQF